MTFVVGGICCFGQKLVENYPRKLILNINRKNLKPSTSALTSATFSSTPKIFVFTGFLASAAGFAGVETPKMSLQVPPGGLNTL